MRSKKPPDINAPGYFVEHDGWFWEPNWIRECGAVRDTRVAAGLDPERALHAALYEVRFRRALAGRCDLSWDDGASGERTPVAFDDDGWPLPVHGAAA